MLRIDCFCNGQVWWKVFLWFFKSERGSVWILWFICSCDCCYSATQPETYSSLFFLSIYFSQSQLKGLFTGYCANKVHAPQTSTSYRWTSWQAGVEKYQLWNRIAHSEIGEPQCQVIKRHRKCLDNPHFSGNFSCRINSRSAHSRLVVGS